VDRQVGVSTFLFSHSLSPPHCRHCGRVALPVTLATWICPPLGLFCSAPKDSFPSLPCGHLVLHTPDPHSSGMDAVWGELPHQNEAPRQVPCGVWGLHPGEWLPAAPVSSVSGPLGDPVFGHLPHSHLTLSCGISLYADGSHSAQAPLQSDYPGVGVKSRDEGHLGTVQGK
jgi:hypothetical protein